MQLWLANDKTCPLELFQLNWGSLHRFTDGVDVSRDDGVIYFTDASTKFGYGQSDLDVLEGRPNGRLLKYDPSTKATSILATDLFFPNGVALAFDQTFLVFCETSKYDIFTARSIHLQQNGSALPIGFPARNDFRNMIDAFCGESDAYHLVLDLTLCLFFMPTVKSTLSTIMATRRTEGRNGDLHRQSPWLSGQYTVDSARDILDRPCSCKKPCFRIP